MDNILYIIFGLIFLVVIVSSLVWAIRDLDQTRIKNEKRSAAIKSKRMRDIVQRARNDWRNIELNQSLKYTTLSTSQKKLIQEWMDNGLFKEYEFELNTIMKLNKYNENDKKLLSNLRTRYMDLMNLAKEHKKNPKIFHKDITTIDDDEYDPMFYTGEDSENV